MLHALSKSSGQVAPYLMSVCNVSCHVSLVSKNVSIASGQVDACTHLPLPAQLHSCYSIAMGTLCVYLTGSSEIHCD